MLEASNRSGMELPRPYRNNILMLNLTTFSVLCLLILVGACFYSGSLIPLTPGAGSRETSVWIMWSVIVGLPSATAVLWLLRLRKDAKPKPDIANNGRP